MASHLRQLAERGWRIVWIVLLASAGLMAATSANADELEATGYITLSRDVPPHSSGRLSEPGTATRVSTARGDVVIATIGRQADGGTTSVNSLPDSILGDIGGRTTIEQSGVNPPALSATTGGLVPAVGETRIAISVGVAAGARAVSNATGRVMPSVGTLIPSLVGAKQ